jgi:hypothetical protein
MNQLLARPRRAGRLLAVLALLLLAGGLVSAAQRASAATGGQPTDLAARPCPVLRSFRPCPPCSPPWLRPCPTVPPTTAPTPPTTTAPEPTLPGFLEAKEFSAFVNRQPLATPTLIVSGTLRVGSPGYAAVLRLPQTQGINPDILLLELVVTPPTRFQAQVVTELPVRFESTDFVAVNEVDIINLGLQIPVTTVR